MNQQDMDKMNKLQREILQFLKEHGPTPLQMLYGKFDPNNNGTANAAILDLVKLELYLAVDSTTQAVTVTSAGVQRLQAATF